MIEPTSASRPDVQRCVGGVLHAADGRLLLIKRGRAPARGTWSLPGGRVEPGESDSHAVARELAEETGLVVAVGRLLGSVDRPAPGGGLYRIFDYECRTIGGHVQSGDDADAAIWVDSATFATLDRRGLLSPGLADALRSWHALPRA